MIRLESDNNLKLEVRCIGAAEGTQNVGERAISLIAIGRHTKVGPCSSRRFIWTWRQPSPPFPGLRDKSSINHIFPSLVFSFCSFNLHQTSLNLHHKFLSFTSISISISQFFSFLAHQSSLCLNIISVSLPFIWDIWNESIFSSWFIEGLALRVGAASGRSTETSL